MTAAVHGQPAKDAAHNRQGITHSEELTRAEVGTDAWHSFFDKHWSRRVRDADPGAMIRWQPAKESSNERVRLGSIATLQYCRFWVDAGVYEHKCVQGKPARHEIMLQAAGRSRLETLHGQHQMAAGDFVLLRDTRQVRIQHEDQSEIIVLFDPMVSDVLQQFGDRFHIHRPGRSDCAAMLQRLLPQACANLRFHTDAAVESIAQTLRTLLGDVLLEQPVVTPSRLDRRLIEMHVLQRLQDPTLSLASVADEMNCSLRTLHRVFRRDGEESLERFILRQRVEACAALLRGQGSRGAITLTDLAMEFGFSSSAHFSTAFRTHFGVSPSVYRRSVCND